MVFENRVFGFHFHYHLGRAAQEPERQTVNREAMSQ
jgi:hypothetical protein